jgi:formylglycine-generating enzyme
MRKQTAFLVVAALFATFILIIQPSAQADTFGSGANTFDISFVNIGNVGNAADTTGYGAVPYAYRVGLYEVSKNDIVKATASGLSNVEAGWTGNQPAASISWLEAAAFANWLNTSTGKQAAYDLAWDGAAWSMNLWNSADAWQLGGENLYRHKDTHYFLPSENEWYKAAYFNSSGLNYFDYATGSDTAPTPVTTGTTSGTAVYGQPSAGGPQPAEVFNAGGLSLYGTMAQGGNIWEFMETAFDGVNDSALDLRATLGGDITDGLYPLSSSSRTANTPTHEHQYIGFRVASVPEPSTYALLFMTGAGALWWSRRKR